MINELRRGVEPGASVIMPVYNQERYVSAAVSSVLRQTYTDFEFVIVDDGSTDRTVEIIESFQDERIRLIRAEHKGFIDALARGTSEARGKWIARMDSDDVCRADRLQKQVDFLNAHPECVLLTTYYGIVTPNDKFLTPADSSGWRYLTARDLTLATVPFCDPGTVFDRRLASEIGYDPQFKWEKTLWYEMLRRGKGAVLETPVYFVRWRIGSVSRGQNRYPTDMSEQIRLKYDAENVQKTQQLPKTRINIRNEKKCVYFYSAAGDFRAARKTALSTWLRFPFHVDAIKLLLISFGIRRPKEARGPAGIKLLPETNLA